MPTVFKDYNGNTLNVAHIHQVSDTKGTRSTPYVGATELLNKTTINLKYYSTTLTVTTATEKLGNTDVIVISTNTSEALNGNLVLKIGTNTTLTPTKEYILVLEPIEDTNSKTNIISKDFGTVAAYNYINASYISEDINHSSDVGFSDSSKYVYRIRPKQDINSIIVYLYTLMKGTNSTKKLLKISIREAVYTSGTHTAFATNTSPGFMSAEDKVKLEKIDSYATYIEDKLQSAVFYSQDVYDPSAE